ncbi:S41 family peptidase [Candidatus Gracilibacteria bacterium]|nr:S41 family peptidase [Candidatus Gracilibacteria bacterium]
MRKFLVLLLISVILVPQGFSFRDVANHSKLYPQIQTLIDKGVMEDGTFFRANDPVPAQMFWKMLLLDAEFDPNSATFETPLPPNMTEDDSLAQFIREAIRRGFIDGEVDFDRDRNVTRSEAIEFIVKTKGILTVKTPSNIFMRKLSNIPKSASYVPYFEAAYASGILEDIDIYDLKPKGLLTRRDFVRWLYNFTTNGADKKSTLNPRGAITRARTLRNRQRTTEEQLENKTNSSPIRIESLNGTINLSEVRSAGEGFRIPNGRILEEIFRVVESKYRFSEQLTEEKKEAMVEAAMTALIKALGDKYSSYIEPEKAKDFRADINGKFEGIGAFVELIEDEFTIVAPIKGSPAEAAGVLAGDIITHVNDEDIAGYSAGKIVDLIKGPAGSYVTLTILRDERTQKITITRGKITIPAITIKWEKSVPVIGIHKFTNNTQLDFAKILKDEVLPKNPRGIVIDLRNNPGGLLTSAVSMGEFFLDRGDTIFFTDYKAGKNSYNSSRKGELFGQKNIVVLQNKGTASASEILSAMIQDYGIGTIIGTKSVGKDSVQEITNYGNGGSLKLTVAKWLTPKGRWFHDSDKEEEQGVIPDIEIPDPTPEERKQEIDHQLDRAIQEVLNR